MVVKCRYCFRNIVVDREGDWFTDDNTFLCGPAPITRNSRGYQWSRHLPMDLSGIAVHLDL